VLRKRNPPSETNDRIAIRDAPENGAERKKRGSISGSCRRDS
jgi:hypothetical protein